MYFIEKRYFVSGKLICLPTGIKNISSHTEGRYISPHIKYAVIQFNEGRSIFLLRLYK